MIWNSWPIHSCGKSHKFDAQFWCVHCLKSRLRLTTIGRRDFHFRLPNESLGPRPSRALAQIRCCGSQLDWHWSINECPYVRKKDPTMNDAFRPVDPWARLRNTSFGTNISKQSPRYFQRLNNNKRIGSDWSTAYRRPDGQRRGTTLA